MSKAGKPYEKRRKGMTRLDGTKKDVGFLGNVKHISGSGMSEQSSGLPGTDEGFYPLLVPGQSEEDMGNLKNSRKLTNKGYGKARAHAETRIAAGDSPFFKSGERPVKQTAATKMIQGAYSYGLGGEPKDERVKYAQLLEPPKKESLWEQAFSAVMDYAKPVRATVAPQPLGKFKEASKAGPNDFPMAKILTAKESAAMDVAGLDRVYGPAWRREVAKGGNVLLPGPGGHLPVGGAKHGKTKGGFSDPLRAKGGAPISPPQTYASPATHEKNNTTFGRDEYLSSQYSFRQARGEKLPTWDVWYEQQIKGMRK